MRTELPLAAMMMAAQRQRPAPGLICHSDRGSQYAAGAYVEHLAVIGATPSMITALELDEQGLIAKLTTVWIRNNAAC